MAQQRSTTAGGVVVGLLLLVGAGWADEAAAVQAIKKLGGTVEVDAQRPGKPVLEVYLGNTKITDAGLKELNELKNLVVLDLDNTVVTDAGLKELKELKSLKVLSLGDAKITDAGLKNL